MKQVLQSRGGLTVVRHVPVPDCPPGGVLVANEFSAISAGTETAIVAEAQKSLLARARARPDLVRQVIARARSEGIRATREAVRRKLDEGTPVGYSSAGRVIHVGSAVQSLSPGDAVACAGAGWANHAEVVAVPRNMCAKVPDGVSMEAAALTTIAAIALHGVRLADVRLGDRVAVIGCGLVGRMSAALLRAAGSEVFAIDLDPDRVALVRAQGADHALLAGDGAVQEVLGRTGGVGVDAVLVTAASTSNAPLVAAADMARDRAAVVVVGDVPLNIARAPMFSKELSLRVSRSYGPGRYDTAYEEHGIDYPIGYVRWTQQRNMESILAMQASGKLDLAPLIEEVLPVDAAADAYGRLVGPETDRPRGALLLAYPTARPERSNTAVAAQSGTALPVGARSPRIALIGPGGFARSVIIPALRAGGATLEVVGGGSGPSADAAAREFGFARTASSAEILADPSVDAVVVCTRHGGHAALAAAALRAGKHVFCEKPLALSEEELDEVLNAADSAQGVLAVGFNRRFAPLVQDMQAFLANKPGPQVATYRVSAGHIPSSHWVHDLENGGGRAVGEVCHFVDTLSYLCGSHVGEVHAVGYGAPDLPVQSQDNLAITLRFRNGSVGSVIYVSDGSPSVPKERIEVFRGDATAVLDNFTALALLDGAASETVRSRSTDKGHDAEINAFLAGLQTGVPPVDLASVRNVSLATLAIVESLRTGAAVAVD